MVMPRCGTFHYAGVVPAHRLDVELGLWVLSDQSGADPKSSWPQDNFDQLRNSRLVGLTPICQVSGAEFILQAMSQGHATVRTAYLTLDQFLLEDLRPGDRVELVRTATANIAVSVFRSGELFWALGAVTAVPLGPSLQVRGGPQEMSKGEWPRRDTWVDISAASETARLRGGEEATLGPYRITVLNTFRDGIPGQYETMVVSTNVTEIHEAALRAAIPFVERVNFKMVMW